MKEVYHWLRRACAFVIGLVFFFAGVFKLMDPVGANLVVEDYLKFLHLGFLDFVSMPLAVGLAFLEAILGIALVTGVYRKVSAIATSVLILFFTIITFILWRKDPPMDCGCFGEVIHLTNAQTFMKNVVLLLLGLIAFLPMKNFGGGKTHKKVPFYLVGASVAALALYSSLYIPMMDFTPFNHSSRLAVTRMYEQPFESEEITTYIYEKGGKEGVFTLDNIPDSTWTFLRVETRLKEDNIFETDYPDLSFWDEEGNYQDALAAAGRVLVVSVYHPEKLSSGKWERTAVLLRDARDSSFTPLLLCATSTLSIPDDVDPALAEVLGEHFYGADYKTLLSLNRSNGGATYFNNGNLIQKWARRNLPSEGELGKLKRKDATDAMLSASSKGRLYFQAFLLYSVAVMILV